MMKKYCVIAVAVMALSFLLLVAGSSRFRAKLIRQYYKAEVAFCLPGLVPSSHLLTPCWDKDGLDSSAFWIAHGGGIGKYVYTNCAEAVQDSLFRGFNFIELDLMETSDGHLVGGHSWEELRALVGHETGGNAALSKSEIESLRSRWKGTPLFADDICRLLCENPQMVLVTDKTQNFELLLREIPFADRMVIEAFSCYDYLRALRAGAKHVALTAWSVYDLKQAQKYKLPGVVLSASVIRDDPAALPLVQQMHREGCCIMVHWAEVSDKPEFVHEHLGRNISLLYTDTWSPRNIPPRPEE